MNGRPFKVGDVVTVPGGSWGTVRYVSDVVPRIRVEFMDLGGWVGYEPGELTLIAAAEVES